VSAVISVAGGKGSALGTTVLAPVLINISSMRTLVYVCGPSSPLVPSVPCMCRQKRHRPPCSAPYGTLTGAARYPHCDTQPSD
jgi:hypothetical protein